MTDLATNLSALEDRLTAELAGIADERALEELRVRFLGRSGEVTAIRRGIGALAPEERPNAGKVINAAVERMESALAVAVHHLGNAQLDAQLAETIDVTLPGAPARIGSIHPIRRVMRDVGTYFTRLGFAVLQGPEIETDANNFDALNIPPDHPAREGLDSFYLRPDLVLRTHTSPMQVRAMRESGPPIAIIVPGKAYRRDAVDARHLYQFHQVEGLMVGPDIHFGHLKGVLTGLMRELFGPQQAVRFRPSFFPFTEPSAEIDTTCPGCGGSGKRPVLSPSKDGDAACRTCGGSGWIEVGGSGMVHPNVLREVGYDPERVAGWAFGCGLERFAMVRYEMNDIRDFVENTPSFLEQTA
jgi:phenylalanyl-tRNA synthetase alpha chain